MARKYVIKEAVFQYWDTDKIGISKDSSLYQATPTAPHDGVINYIRADIPNSGSNRNMIVEIDMPSENDIPDFGELVAIYFRGYNSTGQATPPSVLGVLDLTEPFDEPTASWNDGQPGVPWATPGSVASQGGAIDDGEVVYTTTRSGQGFVDVDITELVKLGDINKRLCFIITSPSIGDWHPVARNGHDGDNGTIIGGSIGGSYFVISGSVFPTSQSKDNVINDSTANNGTYFGSGNPYVGGGGVIVPVTPAPVSSTFDGTFKVPSSRPSIVIVYRSYEVEAFEGEDSLSIQPYENDPEHPELNWGKINDGGFRSYKIYRDTNEDVEINQGGILEVVYSAPGESIVKTTTIHGLSTGDLVEIRDTTNYNGDYTVLGVPTAGQFRIGKTFTENDKGGNWDTYSAKITSANINSYIDPDTLVDGTTYYYKVIAESTYTIAGDAKTSLVVSFTKPDVTSGTLSPSGSQDVGVQVTMTVVSPQNIKRVYVDWKDGMQSWYDFDIVETTKAVTHIYSDDTGGSVTPDVRIEDENGFWSGLTPASNTIDLGDTAPLAKLLVNIKRDHVGVEVTLNAALSQPAGSNVTITSYKFWRYATDPAPVTQSSPIFSFTTTGYSVGTKTAKVEITTSTSLTADDTVNYDLESGDPVELIFSRNTRIHEIPHDLTTEKDFRAPLEGEGIEFQFKTARRAERISVHGTSHTPDMDTDIGILRSAWENDTYIRVRVKNEVEGKDVLYDGKIESDVTLGHSYPNLITWSFNMVVFNRTEV